MQDFVVEMWVWYAITSLVVLARMTSRRMLYGSFSGLLWDDYLMMFAMASYTVLLAVVHVLSYTPTNLINPEDNIVITPEEIPLREHGAKLVLVTEHAQMVTIWAVKGCLLAICGRLTLNLRQHLFVKITAGYVIVSFIVMQILWFTAWCRPFHNYWAVPPDDLNCSAETNHMITNAVFNITSDIMIIFIPMPVLFQSQLPPKRKIVLIGVFALGIFTIAAAAASKYYSLATPFGINWIYWYIREVSTSVIVANLPLTWTFLQRVFKVGSFAARYGRSNQSRTGGPTGVDGPATGRLRSNYGNLASCTREDRKHSSRVGHGHDMVTLGESESQERINHSSSDDDIALKIFRHDEIEIKSESVDR